MTVSLALPGTVEVLETPDDVALRVAEWISNLSREAVAARGSFTIALAGGSTPHKLYQLLARPPFLTEIAWRTWDVFYSDERACAPDDPASNYGTSRTLLLDHVPVDLDHIHRMPADAADINDAAAQYSALLLSELDNGDGIPRFDCVLLGLGEDGHTASLFPGDPAIAVTDTWCAHGRADYEPYDRMTLTFPTINAAHHVAMLVTGNNKRAALRDVVTGTAPAARVQPYPGHLYWFLDRAADSPE